MALPSRVSLSSCSCEDYVSIGHPCGSSSNTNCGETLKPISAERYKTKLCCKYMAAGVCPYKSRCMFAHGKHELRTAKMNVRDGLVTEEAIRAFRRQCQRMAALQPHYDTYPDGSSSYNTNDMNGPHMNDGGYSPPIPLPGGHCNCCWYYHYPQEPYPHESPHLHDDAISPYYCYDSMYNGIGPHPISATTPLPFTEVPYVYTHNPYACDLLPPENRLYSKPHVYALLPTPQGEAEVDDVQQAFYNDLNDASLGSCAAVITTEPSLGSSLLLHPPAVKQEEDGVGFSSCSSLGSASGDVPQLSPNTPCATGVVFGEADEGKLVHSLC